MSETSISSRVHCTIDLLADGLQFGDLLVRHSDNARPLAPYTAPIASLSGGRGPILLLIGGVHGDEFEGPSAIMRLLHGLQADDISGQIIFMPTLNLPAVIASSRVSPLDGVNLNRAFPGERDGGPSAQLAHYVEHFIMPRCSAVIDLHSGGKASVFATSSLASRHSDTKLFQANLDLAVAFGLPYLWVLGEHNDDRSVNSAALRKRVPMMATELGGSGGSGPVETQMAEDGIRRCLRHIGITRDGPDPAPRPRTIELGGPSLNLTAPARGIFDRRFSAGDDVSQGELAGHIHFVDEISRPPIAVPFPGGGFVLAHSNRGFVERGDMLAVVTRDCDVAPAVLR